MCEPASSDAAGATGLGRIMLVDDERSILRAYGRVLRDAGFTVVALSNAEAVAGELDKTAFDVVVSDVHLNGSDGIDVLRTVHDRDPDLPVVLMTASSDLRSAVQAVEYGAMRYLLKPVPASVLSGVATTAVLRHRDAALKRRAWEHYLEEADQRCALHDVARNFERALERIYMAYQPIVSFERRAVIAYEALLRSSEPSLPRPDVLFEVAERLHRVPDLGRIIRRQVAETLKVHQEAQLFVNIHPRDLNDDELFAFDSPLSGVAARVVLEITERTSLRDVSDLDQRLAALRGLGYRLAIDDLGAGYAGLAAFTQIQPDVVKLDMSLIRHIEREPTKRKLIESMAKLCAELGILLVAEGVETLAERDALRSAGCDLLQGYLFAKPGPALPKPSFGDDH